MVKFIPTKRKSKNVSVKEYWDYREKNKPRQKEQSKKKQIQYDLSRRHRFKTQSEKRKGIDISIGHKIEEINLLPSSYENDNIGSFWLDSLQKFQSQARN